MNASPFAFVQSALQGLPEPDAALMKPARATKAGAALDVQRSGRLDELGRFFAGWQRRAAPEIAHPHVLVLAGQHGVAAQGVSAAPANLSQQRMGAFRRGTAAVSRFCTFYGLPLNIRAPSSHRPTHDFSEAMAMSEAECAQAVRFGMRSVPEPCDLLLLGALGAGGSSAAGAIVCALLRRSPHLLVDKRANLGPRRLQQKAHVIWRGLQLHKKHLDDPLAVLRAFGGREIAALFGALLEARRRGVPVILDGLVTASAALVLHALDANAVAHCLAGHRAADKGQEEILYKLGLEPLLDLQLRLSEGAGAVLAFGIIQAALAVRADAALGGAVKERAKLSSPPASSKTST